MDNTRTIIRSSIISLVIVAIGLFLLCVSRAPKINTDNGATSERTENKLGSNEEQALLSLLDEAESEMGSSEEGTTDYNASDSQKNSTEGDDLAALLSEGEQTFSSDELANNSEVGTNELMDLLQTEEPQQTEQNDLLALTQSASAYSENEVNQTSSEAASEVAKGPKATTNLTDQISYLENVLNEKISEKQRLENEIKNYDLQIAQLESGSKIDNNFNMKKASYIEKSVNQFGEENTNFTSDYQRIRIDDYDMTYQEALRLFHENHYNDAANTFYQLVQANPRHQLADNSQYWMGECRYAQGMYFQAIVEFTKVLAYDAADKKDDAQLMLGLCYLKLGEKQYAVTELDWLVSTFAASEYISKAYHYLGQL